MLSLIMAIDRRYEDVKMLFAKGEIKIFSDILKAIPKSVVARDLGKEKGRFDELIDNPRGFKFKDIIQLCFLCKVQITEWAIVLEAGYPEDKKTPNNLKDHRYQITRFRFNERLIINFEDLFDRISVSKVADDIGKKSGRLSELKDNVKEFFVKDIIEITRLFELPLTDMLKLVEAQYNKQILKSQVRPE
jgi:hypothetical protein